MNQENGGARAAVVAAREFAAAHDVARGDDDSSGAACNRRMLRITNATRVVRALAGLPDLPAAVEEFLRADSDPACPRCRYASGPPEHPECAARISRWFTARDALVAFGRAAGKDPS